MSEWEAINKLISQSMNNIQLELLDSAESVVTELGIDESSILGHIVKKFSNITVNNYLRLLCGNSKKENIITVNARIKKIYPGNKLIVATDIWGGLFAINNGDFDEQFRDIWYFAPDELQWIDLDINYSQFISWICGNTLDDFYKHMRWRGMDYFIKGVSDNQAVLIYPFLWSNECNIEEANKKVVDLYELIEINAKYQKKFFQ